jgi:hypothetical protein
MHLLYSSRLTWLVVGGAVLFLGIMLTLTMSDYLTRGWLPERGPQAAPLIEQERSGGGESFQAR